MYPPNVDKSSGGRASAAGNSGLVLVSLAAVTWDFRLVGRTRMLTEAWARAGQPTVFVQVPSYRTALERLLAPLRPAPPVSVIRPWPAPPARRWLRLGEPALAKVIRRRAAGLRRQLERVIRWEHSVALVVSPVWTPWLDELPFRHVVYDCIDELAVHVPRPELAPLYEAWEEQLVARAAGAVVTAESLGDRLRARRPDLKIATIRNGVDVDRFQALAAQSPRPRDVPLSPRPIVGFVGALYQWIDWELIHQTARALPEFDFVLVGPHDRGGAARRMPALPNVRFLGPRSYDRVPAYIDAFTVGWVPFRQDAVGTAANPVKIYEYLALGKPVVTTPVADPASYEGLVTVARTAEEMASALRAAESTATQGNAARVAFARRNDWSSRAADIVRFLATL